MKVLKEVAAEEQEKPAMKENILEAWENEAEAFHKATGYLRPGKDAGIMGGSGYIERRDKAWSIWCAGYNYCAEYISVKAPADEGLAEKLSELPCIDCDGAQADCGSDGNENPCNDCHIKKNAKKATKEILSRHKSSADKPTSQDKDGGEAGLRAVKDVYEDIMLNEDTEYDTAESVAIKLGEILMSTPAPVAIPSDTQTGRVLKQVQDHEISIAKAEELLTPCGKRGVLVFRPTEGGK